MLWPPAAAVGEIVAINHPTRAVRYVRFVRVWMQLRRHGACPYSKMDDFRCIRSNRNKPAGQLAAHVHFDLNLPYFAYRWVISEGVFRFQQIRNSLERILQTVLRLRDERLRAFPADVNDFGSMYSAVIVC